MQPTRFAPLWTLLYAVVIAGPAAALAADKGSAAMEAAVRSISSKELQAHVDHLANDTFEGRAAGTRGGRAAGVYLSAFFEKYGLKPAGDGDSYFQRFDGNCRNILGLLEGSDAKLKHQTIVVGAHYDHVGYGTQENSYGPIGYIHNGADDNASGTSGMLELIEAMQKLPAPKRSVLFVLWDSEENGLLGSKHWLTNRSMPTRNIPLTVNLDMIGRLRDQKVEVFGCRTGSNLQHMVCEANRETDLWIDFNWEIKANSDHHPFFERRIPFLMFHTGLHPQYHRPSDDAHRINAKGMEQVTKLVLRLLADLANRDELPDFRAKSARESPVTLARLQNRRRLLAPSRLGVSFDSDEESGGLLLRSVSSGSAAERAGLRPGDVIMGIQRKRILGGRMFQRMVLTAPKQVALLVRRSGEDRPQELPVELDGKRVRVGISWRMDDAQPGSAVVHGVVPNSPADAAGLRTGDRIFRISGESFRASQEVFDLLTTLRGPLAIEFERMGRIRTVELDVPPPATTSDETASR